MSILSHKRNTFHSRRELVNLWAWSWVYYYYSSFHPTQDWCHSSLDPLPDQFESYDSQNSLNCIASTPSAWPRVFDFVSFSGQNLYLAMTRQESMKYLRFSGQEYCELGACVNLQSHFKSHIPPSSEVVSKTILMGQPGLSFYVPVVRSIITLSIPYIILKKDVAIVLP